MWATCFSRKKKPGHCFPFNATQKYLPFTNLLCSICFQKIYHSKEKIVFICRRNASFLFILLCPGVAVAWSGWMEPKRSQKYGDCNQCHIPGVLPVLVHQHVLVLIIILTISGNFGKLDSGETPHKGILQSPNLSLPLILNLCSSLTSAMSKKTLPKTEGKGRWGFDAMWTLSRVSNCRICFFLLRQEINLLLNHHSPLSSGSPVL